MEEELFYPAGREQMSGQEDAYHAHEAKDLLADLASRQPQKQDDDEKAARADANVPEHVEKGQSEMLSAAAPALSTDRLEQLREQLAEDKNQLGAAWQTLMTWRPELFNPRSSVDSWVSLADVRVVPACLPTPRKVEIG